MNINLFLKKLWCIAFLIGFLNKLNAQANAKDSLALVDIYNKTGGEYWVDKKNWLTKAPLSTWEGVSVNSVTERVTSFVNTGQMDGNLPVSIGDLTELRLLILNRCGLKGTIPESLGNLVNLQTLDFDRCSFSGDLPESFGKLISLQSLNLTQNEITGLPSSFGNLKALQNIDLSFNQLKLLPTSFGDLGSLKTLNMCVNYLSELPISFGKLTNLQWIELSTNQLKEIPSSMGDLQYLYMLDLAGNQLTSLPSEIGKLQGLYYLYLAGNQLTQLPAEIGNIPYLKSLHLANNQLTSIPSSLGNLKSLRTLYLSMNDIAGTIPSFLGNLTNLDSLGLGDNQFIGTIPASLGNLKNLKTLDLEDNQLEEPIPSSLSNLKSLIILSIDRNKFTFDGLEQIRRLLPSIRLTYNIRNFPRVNYLNDSTMSFSVGGTLTNNKYTWIYFDSAFRWQGDTIITGDSTFNLNWTKSEYILVDAQNSFVHDGCFFDSDTINVNLKTFIKNPNPSLVNDDGTINPDISNLSFENDVTGAATDGVTKLLLLAKSDDPLTFSLENTKEGKLSSLSDQEQYQNNITANSVTGKVAVIYTVPDGYGKEFAAGGREIKIKVRNIKNDSTTISLNLITPPVVLVHGMWSDPEVWKTGGFVDYLYNAQLLAPFLADYAQHNAETFNPENAESVYGITAVLSKIKEALEAYRNNKIAVTQVDVVGHSLGGLMARSFSQQPTFKFKTNYYQGSIHKLITLGTPHRGSPLGPELYRNRNRIVDFPFLGLAKVGDVFKNIKKPIGTCHADFGITSEGILALKQTLPYKTFSIIGDYDGSNDNGKLLLDTICKINFSQKFRPNIFLKM